MTIELQEQQVVDLDADHPVAFEDAPVVAIEAEVEAEFQRVVPEAFSVRCQQTAGWVVRRIVQARRYADNVKVWAELERRRAQAEEARLMFLFAAQLREWTTNEIAKLRGRRKSIGLPGGTVGFRAVPSRVLVHDESTVITWARQACPAAIVVSEKLIKTPIAEYVHRTGDIPVGIEITVPHDEFFVR